MVSSLHLRPHGILHLALFVSVGLARGIFGQVNILESTAESVGYANGQDVWTEVVDTSYRVIKATGVVISKAGSFDPLEAEVPSLIGKIGWEIETGISLYMRDDNNLFPFSIIASAALDMNTYFLGLSLADEAGVKFLHNNFWYFHHLDMCK